MKKKILQIGVIGGGMIAQAHMNNFRNDKRTEIRWIADISQKATETSAKKFGIRHATRDYKDMLKDPELDAIVVCTPPDTHRTIGIDVIRAGKHLLLEKPMATTTADAKAIVKEAKKHSELVISGCSCRHARLNPKFSYIKKIISSGKLGKIYHIRHCELFRQGRGGIEYNPKAKWFLDRKIAGGGPLFDWGVYDLSFHLGILGDKPKFLKADGFCANGLDKHFPRGKGYVEEHGNIFMHFSQGLTYSWERANNVHSEFPGNTRIYGTKGGLSFDYHTWGCNKIEYYYVGKDRRGKAKKKILKVNMSKHKGDMAELGKAFIDALTGKGPVPMSLDFELANLQIILAAYKGARW